MVGPGAWLANMGIRRKMMSAAEERGGGVRLGRSRRRQEDLKPPGC